MPNKMKFLDALSDLTDVLEVMAAELMKNEMENYSNDILIFSKLMEMCFPQIIISYSDPILSEVSGDAAYWTDQFDRIMDALEKKDKFTLIDVLYHETRTNMLSFIDMIKDTHIAELMLDVPQSE